LPNHYHILGLDRDATSADIKKAYRKLAKEYHPDTNQGDLKAEEKFKAISEAYYVLSDADRRYHYDQKLDEPEIPEEPYNQQQTYHQQQQAFYRSMYVENSDVPYFKLKMAAFIFLIIALVGVMTMIFKPWDVPGGIPPEVMIMQINNTRIEMRPEHPYYRVLLRLFHSSIRKEDDLLRIPALKMEMMMDSIEYGMSDPFMDGE
jgi:curved DNA-binding protein CbpA